MPCYFVWKHTRTSPSHAYTKIFKWKKVVLGQIFFTSRFIGFFSRFRVRGTKKKKSSENDQFTGHFQSFFLTPPEKLVKLWSVFNL